MEYSYCKKREADYKFCLFYLMFLQYFRLWSWLYVYIHTRPWL